MRAFENDPASQGELLRKALTDQIRSAIRAGEIQRVGKHYSIAIEDLIKQYVSEGSTFDYAENVLKGAGFSLHSRPSPDSPGMFVGSEYEFDVNGFLGIEDVKCVVALRPAGPYDYGLVHRVLTDCGFMWSPVQIPFFLR